MPWFLLLVGLAFTTVSTVRKTLILPART
jgi:hypothetical protein